MLQSLGINLCENLNVDTWFLQTIRARLVNNCREYYVDDHAHIAINLLYAFLNDSCDPNVDWIDDGETCSSTVTMSTTSSIGNGDELLINHR